MPDLVEPSVASIGDELLHKLVGIQKQLADLKIGQEEIAHALSRFRQPTSGVEKQPAELKTSQEKCCQELDTFREPVSPSIGACITNGTLPTTPQELSSQRGEAHDLLFTKASPQAEACSPTKAPGRLHRQVLQRKTERLKRCLELAEDTEVKPTRSFRSDSGLQLNIAKGFSFSDRAKYAHQIDLIMGFIISANLIFIGVALDHRPQGRMDVWFVFDLIFSASFIVEFCVRLAIDGCKEYFCGKDAIFNTIDASVVLSDCVQCVLDLTVLADMPSEEKPSISILRVARLMKLTRLVRLFKIDSFNELVTLVQGLADSFIHLKWAILVFCLLMYTTALFCRCFLGVREKPHVKELFETVPRAMFTVFRCSFGDCSTREGEPLSEWVHQSYGAHYTVAYAAILFVIQVGLFNIINAIFVDATITSAKLKESNARNERLSNERIFAAGLYMILKRLLELDGSYNHILEHHEAKLSDHFKEIACLKFVREELDRVLEYKEVKEILSHLDIDKEDHCRLSEVLDPDRNGHIEALDLMNGLARLRGDPRRSDIITMDLMIRCIQEKQDDAIHNQLAFLEAKQKGSLRL